MLPADKYRGPNHMPWPYHIAPIACHPTPTTCPILPHSAIPCRAAHKTNGPDNFPIPLAHLLSTWSHYYWYSSATLSPATTMALAQSAKGECALGQCHIVP